MTLNVAVMWPKPRADRWKNALSSPDQYPDLSDGLLFLEKEDIQAFIVDPHGFPLNPFAWHSVFCGLDPLCAARLITKSRRYDAIISVGCTSAPCLAWMKKILGISVPILLIDPLLSDDYPRLKRLQDKTLPLVDKVVVYGRVQLDYLRREYGEKVHAVFVPHRVDTDFYKPMPSGSADPSRRPFILSIGNDTSRDFETLIRAATTCTALDAHGTRVLIHTVRPIHAMSPRVEICRDHISFSNLRELYRQASLIVLPLKDTTHAGGINSLLEAMSMARPVVVSGSRGVIDYVAHNETAYVTEPGDSAGLAQAIEHLLRYPDEAHQLGKNARAFVQETCRNPLYAKTIATFLADLVCTSKNKT